MTAFLQNSILSTGAAELGGTAELFPGSTADRVLQLSAKDHCITDVIVVSLGLEIVGDVPTLCNHQIRARVNWGSPKGNNSALIDWKHGTRFTVEGSAVDVSAIYAFAPLPAGQPANDGPRVRVYASVGPGTIGRNPQTTLTMTSGPGDMIATGTALFLIPRFATAVEMQDRRDPNAMPLPVLLGTFFAGQTAGSRAISRFSETNVPITIPNGAESFLITNASASATEANAVFHMDL